MMNHPIAKRSSADKPSLRIMDVKGVRELNRTNLTYRKHPIVTDEGMDQAKFLYVDEYGVLWLGTNNKGLYRGVRNKEEGIEFKSFLSDTSRTGNCPGNHIPELRTFIR